MIVFIAGIMADMRRGRNGSLRRENLVSLSALRCIEYARISATCPGARLGDARVLPCGPVVGAASIAGGAESDCVARAVALRIAAQMKVEFHSFFNSLDSEARQELVALTEHQVRGADECIFAEGDSPDALYLVLDGEVEIRRRTAAGQVAALARVRPNDFFGEMGVLDGFGRSASAHTVDHCGLGRIPADALLSVLEKQPGSATVALFRGISARLRQTNDAHLRTVFQSERTQLLRAAIDSLQRSVEHRVMHCGDQVRTLSAALDGSFDLDRRLVSVRELLDDLHDRNRAFVAAHSVELDVEPCQGEVAVDPLAILVAMENLLTNAVESMGGRPGHVQISSLWRPSVVEISLADNGAGIAVSDRDRVFTDFFTTRSAPALGLGLTVSKAVIEAHGGVLVISSSDADGTTLTLTLPTELSLSA